MSNRRKKNPLNSENTSTFGESRLLDDMLIRNEPSHSSKEGKQEDDDFANSTVFLEQDVLRYKKDEKSEIQRIEDKENESVILEPNTSIFELNLDGGSPMLNRFNNPFDETPEGNEKNRSGQANEQYEVKTPTKNSSSSSKNMLNDSDKLSSADFVKDFSITAADKFRALKEQTKNGHVDELQLLDTSNVGFVVDMRSSEDHEDNSIIDDSSIKLNLIPNLKNRQIEEETQDTNLITQADGDVHEEANRLSRRQRSTQIIVDNEDEDEEFFLLDNSAGGHLTVGANFNGSGNKDEQGLWKQNKLVENSEESPRIKGMDFKSKSMPHKITTASQENAKELYKSLPLNTQSSDIHLNYGSVASAQDISESDKENKNEVAHYQNYISSGEIIQEYKETQVVDNYSQSLVMEEDENEEKDTGMFVDELGRKRGNNDKYNKNVVDEDVGEDEDEDEDGETIKTGKHILQTFRIEEESQSQSQRSKSQSEFHTQPHSSPQKGLNPISPMRTKTQNNSFKTNFVYSNSDPLEELHIKSSQENEPFVVSNKVAHSNRRNFDNENTENIILSHISSPIDLAQTQECEERKEQAESVDVEIPNTSAVSISKLDINIKDIFKESDGFNKTNATDIKDVTSTPINKKVEQPIEIALPNDATKHPMITKLKNVLITEQDDKIATNMSDWNHHRINNKDTEVRNDVTQEICRDNQKRKVDLEDVLQSNCVFFINHSSRIPGYVSGILETGNSIFVTLKTQSDDIVIEHSKIYAPICFNIGDQIKYSFDKRSNYVVTGLKKSNARQLLVEDVARDKDKERKFIIETIDGFDKLYIKKYKRNSNEEFEEFEVNVEDIYLTGGICRNYQYKFFNDADFFQKYIRFQINRIHSANDSISNGTNPDDTLLNILPKHTDNSIRNSSFINTMVKGAFSKCLFIVTGISSSSRVSSSGGSKPNTPRHQRDKDTLPMIVDFIESQGGTVLQESGFEDLIKFKIKNQSDEHNSVRYNNRLRRKVKRGKASKRKMGTSKITYHHNSADTLNTDIDDVNNTMNLIKKHDHTDFQKFECCTDRGEYFEVTFDEVSGEGEEEDDKCIFLKDGIQEFEFGCVISTRHVRTLKYLECLCLKWPIVHIEFIKQCMAEERVLGNWREEWMKYLLIGGECSKLNCSMGLDIFKFYDNWRRGCKLKDQMGLNRLFNGERIIIINHSIGKFQENIKAEIDFEKEGFNSNKRRRRTDPGGLFRPAGGSERWIKEEEDDNVGSMRDLTKAKELRDGSSSTNSSIDGPTTTESLLWIFCQIGFKEAIVIRENGAVLPSLRPFLSTASHHNRNYMYFRHGKDIGQFTEVLHSSMVGADGFRCINWEWIVQSVISNCKTVD